MSQPPHALDAAARFKRKWLAKDLWLVSPFLVVANTPLANSHAIYNRPGEPLTELHSFPPILT